MDLCSWPEPLPLPAPAASPAPLQLVGVAPEPSFLQQLAQATAAAKGDRDAPALLQELSWGFVRMAASPATCWSNLLMGSTC